MKLYQLSLSLGLAAFALASAPASAADWNYGAGGLKDFGGAAVPVPAPVPVPDYAARYYFRLDAGIGFGDSPTGTEQGYFYGDDAGGGPWPMRSGWFNNDFDSLVTLGAGAGVYIGSGFRLDLTAETRSQGKVKINGEQDYRVDINNEGRVRVRDETTLRGGIFLANGYYDFDRGPSSRFTPYIGAGIGFAWNELKRNHSTIEFSRGCSPSCSGAFTRGDSDSVQDKTHDIVFAATATAGLAYRITDYALIDMNYRYLYAGSTDVGLGINGRNFGGNSKVTIGETHEHQIRAGLRFDVN
jgi:opacity protein-like surface antigen